MSLREWLAFPVCLLAELFEDGGAWIGGKLHDLSMKIAGPLDRTAKE